MRARWWHGSGGRGWRGRPGRRRAVAAVAAGCVWAFVAFAGPTVAAAASPWVVAHTANQGYSDWLQGVSCASKTFCVSVGGYVPAKNQLAKTLIESNSGGKWVIVPSPSPGATSEL